MAGRDDSRVARRLYRKQEIDGVYRLDRGAVLDDFFHFLQTVGVALLEPVQGAAIQEEIIAFVQYVLFYRLKTPLFRLNAAKSDHVRFVHAGSLPPHTPDAL